MSVNDFMTSHIQECSDIIHKEIKDKTFDSHEFIRHFSKRFEVIYSGFLSQYNKTPFRIVNSQIGAFLKNNQTKLGIAALNKTKSQSVFGKNVPNHTFRN